MGYIPWTRFKLTRKKGGKGRKGRRSRLLKPSPIFFRGQCCQQACKSWTGRFSQLQAELEVRSYDPGHQPAPRQISFVEYRKTLPHSPLAISTRFYNPHRLAASKRRGSFFFYPSFGTEHQAALRIHQTSAFWQNVKLALKCLDEPTARTFSATMCCVDANDMFSGTFSKTENEIVNTLTITL